MVRHTALALFLMATACGDWRSLPDPPTNLADAYNNGLYSGPLFLEARAYAGPVKVKEGFCATTMRLRVDHRQPEVVRGEVECDLGAMGVLDLEIASDFIDAPEVDGVVVTDEFDATWQGWFHDEGQLLYAETLGETKEEGVRIEYVGWFQVQWAVPLKRDRREADDAPPEQGAAIGA